MTKILEPGDVDSLDLPPLATAPRRALPLDNRRVPSYLHGTRDKVLGALRGNAKVVFVDLRGRTQPDGPEGPAGNDDVCQLLREGIARSPDAEGYATILPGDGNAPYRDFAQTVVAAEELVQDPLLYRGQPRRGYVVALPDDVEERMGVPRARLNSKMERLFGGADAFAKAGDIPRNPTGDTLYRAWLRHMQGADVTEFRRLLKVAGAHPRSADGAPARATQELPGGEAFEVAPNQQEAVTALLRAWQGQIALRHHVLLTGEVASGKTTLLAAYYQLLTHLRLSASYLHVDAGGKATGSRTDKRLFHCIDQMEFFGGAFPQGARAMTANTEAVPAGHGTLTMPMSRNAAHPEHLPEIRTPDAFGSLQIKVHLPAPDPKHVADGTFL